MELFELYVCELERLAAAALGGQDHLLAEVRFVPLLNGAVGAELRKRVPLADRQEMGAFFTGASLRARALGPVVDDLDAVVRVWDPACGAGDLLLSYAASLPALPDLTETISSWEGRLFGSDLQPLFIRAARARLVLAAYDRGARAITGAHADISAVFPGLRAEDSFAHSHRFAEADHIVLNPPYINMRAPAGCNWASGKISAAAVFVSECLAHASSGTRLVAILPDVLRTGSRYRKWRALVAKSSKITRVEVFGAFDPQADVDVFVLEAVIGEIGGQAAIEDTIWNPVTQTSTSTIGDLFTVSVGSVVPHRDPEDGPIRPFLHAKNAPRWGTMLHIEEVRAWNGKVVEPPFVVIRRTSSPSDRWRAIGTLVLGEDAVAVENHLIILTPKLGGVEECRRVLAILQQPSTDAWLNERMRCRHLTVEAVRQIPLPQEDA